MNHIFGNTVYYGCKNLILIEPLLATLVANVRYVVANVRHVIV